MALVVVDASVIIGFLDPEDAIHAPCLAALSRHQRDDLAIPASVYAEILVAPYGTNSEAVAEVDAFLSDFGVRIEPVTAAIARAAAALRSERVSLRLPDALVLGTADELSADIVLAGDRTWAAVTERVVVVTAHG